MKINKFKPPKAPAPKSSLPKISAAAKSVTKQSTLRQDGIAKLSAFSESRTTPRAFGKPSHSSAATSSSGSGWTSLLKSTISGGGLVGTLASVAGFGPIISGIASLFGGGSKTPAPLVKFQLPASQQQVVTIGGSAPNPAIHGAPAASTAQQNAQIVNTVKQALLNSSVLNDVIAEI